MAKTRGKVRRTKSTGKRRSAATRSRKPSGYSAKKRATVKRATRSAGGTVKLVIEHAKDSAVARPDGLAGAFQVTPKAGRARF